MLHQNITRIASKAKTYGTVIYALILLAFSCLYFLRLFYPRLQVFDTPDVFASDLLHINFSLKSILADSIKNNQLPYWNWNIGNGFPLIGESQIGAFYIMNLILFKILPFVYAFNIGYILTFFVSSLGCFLYFKTFVKDKLICVLTALIFTYSAPMFVQITHYNLLQAYSLIPIIFYFFENLLTAAKPKNKVILFVFLILALTQQFYAGYAMTTFMTLAMLMFYMVLRLLFLKRKTTVIPILARTAKLFFVIGISLLFLSASQLFPLVEFAMNSVRNTGPGNISVANSLSISSLLSYFKFDYHSVFNSSYKSFSAIKEFSKNTNLLWDGNLYIGVITFISVLILLIVFIRNKTMFIFFALLMVSLLLSLGINSPFSFLYGIPPFSFFRTPFRFTIFMAFYSIIIYSYGIRLALAKYGKDKRKLLILKLAIYTLMIITIYDLSTISHNYHGVTDVKNIYENRIADFLNNSSDKSLRNEGYSIYAIGNELIWYQAMLYNKWGNKDIYNFLMKDMSSYVNELHRIPSSNIFFASYFAPKDQFFSDNFIRLSLSETLKDKGIAHDFDPAQDYKAFLSNIYYKQSTIPEETLNALRIKGVKYLITPFNFSTTNDLTLMKSFDNEYDGNIYHIRLYEINNSFPKFYFPKIYIPVNTTADAVRILKSPPSLPFAFGFEDLSEYSTKNNRYTIYGLTQKKDTVELKVASSYPGLMIASVSNYPGLNVYVDGVKTNTYKVNFNHMAIRVSQGTHTIRMKYEPWWKEISLAFSVFGHLTLLLVAGYIYTKRN